MKENIELINNSNLSQEEKSKIINILDLINENDNGENDWIIIIIVLTLLNKNKINDTEELENV